VSAPERRPQVIASERMHQGWIGLRVDTLRYANGHEGTIDVVEHRGGVTLVAFDAEGRLLMVRQYRHPAARELLELPAGTLDAGEAPETCAERELREETGYRPGRIERMGGFYLAPGYCSEYQHVFLCGELSESPLESDDLGEDVRLVRVTLDEALRLAAAGEIEDAKTLGALLLYTRRRP
jgi:ADP-ribose pyrophosphatase